MNLWKAKKLSELYQKSEACGAYVTRDLLLEIRYRFMDKPKELLLHALHGHARSLRAKQLGSKSIEAVILSPDGQVDFGIVKVAREMSLKSLDDIKIPD